MKKSTALILALIIAAGVYVYNNVLWGDDKIVFELAVECFDNEYYDPENYCFVGGNVSIFEDGGILMYANVVQRSEYGRDKGDRVELVSTGRMYSRDGYGSLDYDKSRSNFNVDKVNRALERHFK